MGRPETALRAAACPLRGDAPTPRCSRARRAAAPAAAIDARPPTPRPRFRDGWRARREPTRPGSCVSGLELGGNEPDLQRTSSADERDVERAPDGVAHHQLVEL